MATAADPRAQALDRFRKKLMEHRELDSRLKQRTSTRFFSFRPYLNRKRNNQKAQVTV